MWPFYLLCTVLFTLGFFGLLTRKELFAILINACLISAGVSLLIILMGQVHTIYGAVWLTMIVMVAFLLQVVSIVAIAILWYQKSFSWELKETPPLKDQP